MLKQKSTESPQKFDTLIGAKTVVEGTIESEGTLRVDGKVIGDLKVSGDVVIGGGASVIGNVNAVNVFLSGTVEGNIFAAGLLRMLSTAKLLGDIQVQSFVADEGGLFQGKCNMLESSPAADKVTVLPPSKKNGRDYKKSSVINQVYDEREKTAEVKD